MGCRLSPPDRKSMSAEYPSTKREFRDYRQLGAVGATKSSSRRPSTEAKEGSQTTSRFPGGLFNKVARGCRTDLRRRDSDGGYRRRPG